MPEARISPKVIFIGRARAGMPHDSADRAGSEAYSLGLGRPCALAWISTARNPPNACFVRSPSLSWDLNEIC